MSFCSSSLYIDFKESVYCVSPYSVKSETQLPVIWIWRYIFRHNMDLKCVTLEHIETWCHMILTLKWSSHMCNVEIVDKLSTCFLFRFITSYHLRLILSFLGKAKNIFCEFAPVFMHSGTAQYILRCSSAFILAAFAKLASFYAQHNSGNKKV